MGSEDIMSASRASKRLKVGRTECLQGTVAAPPSKSYTHRAILIGSLANRATVVNPLKCDDTTHTLALCRKLGAQIVRQGNRLVIRGCDGTPRIRGGIVDAGEAGTLLRFVLPVLALAKGKVVASGKGSLRTRPNRQVVDVMQGWGVDIAGRGANHCLPLTIKGTGSLAGGIARVAGDVTSQVVSALLIVAPFARKDVRLRLSERLVSRPYVDITMDVLKWAGVDVGRRGYMAFRVKSGQRIRPRGVFRVHGDYSSASFLLGAAALTKSDVTISDLVADCQGDRRFVAILRAMGVRMTVQRGSVRVRGPFDLKAVEVDCSDTPDLVPILAALACFAEGTTRIKNVAHLVHKESNRLAGPAEQLNRLGGHVRATRNSLVIRGSKTQGGTVSGCNDHRLAMALAVAGMRTNSGVVVTGAECISKSYPGFVSDMKKLGGSMALV